MSKMLKFKKKYFTLVEILTVIAIISILAGILLPSLLKTKQRAREVRWLAFNSVINRDGDTVLNYNFMYDDYAIRSNSSLVPALRNGAIGCTVDGFEPKDYDGIIIGSYEWRKGAGRWNGFNNALQFDGISTYIEIPGEKALDFDPLKNDFTVMAWIFTDNLSLPQTLLFKTQLSTASQYELTIYASKIDVTLGGVTQSWNQTQIKAGKWTHIALVAVNASCKVYVNGVDLNGLSAGNTSTGYVTRICKIFPAGLPLADMQIASLPFLLAANTNAQGGNASGATVTPSSGVAAQGQGSASNANAQSGNASGTTVTPPSGAATQGQGNAYGTLKNKPGKTSTAQASMSITPMRIGSTALQNSGTTLNFSGKMDEFIFIRRALSPNEIKGCWQMGNPY